MILEKHYSLHGHSAEVLCVDITAVWEIQENRTRTKNLIASGTSSGELKVWKSFTRRVIAKTEHSVPIVQLVWLPHWKCGPPRWTAETDPNIPCIEEVTLVAQQKRERIVFYSMVPCGLEYSLIPQYEMKTQFHAFTRLRSITIGIREGNHTEALLVPHDKETIRVLLPTLHGENCNAQRPVAPQVFELFMTQSKGDNYGDMMVFIPFIGAQSDDDHKTELTVIAGYESGKACFWSVSTSFDLLSPENTRCTPCQSFGVSDEPILCGATHRRQNSIEKIRVAMGTVDGKIKIFERSTDDPVLTWRSKGAAIIGGGTGCSVNDLAFDDTGTRIVAVSRDSTIRCFDVETSAVHCSLSLSCLSISHGLNKTNGLHCIGVLRDQSKPNDLMRNLLTTNSSMSPSSSVQGTNHSILSVRQPEIINSFVVGGSEGRLLLINLCESE